MKKLNWAALLLVALLLLSGCNHTDNGTLTYETIFEKTAASLKEGHLFFAAKVLKKEQTNTQITYYDAEPEVNTFYEVEVTDDIFGFLPARNFTVGVLGTTENFSNRTELKVGEIYLFDCTLWMQGEELILLLPTFHNSLPQWNGGYLSYTLDDTRYGIEGDYKGYKKELKKMAEEQGYGPQAVLDSATARLQAAAQKDAAYFENLEFKNLDTAAVEATVGGAKARLALAEKTPATAEGIKELLQ